MASEYIKYQCRDAEPEQPLVLTPEQKRKNWSQYHKWHIILGEEQFLEIEGDPWRVSAWDGPSAP